MTSTTTVQNDIDSSTKDKHSNNDDGISNLTESFAALMPQQLIDKYETRFYNNCKQSNLYKPSGMVIPKLPMYHPYHPFRNTIGDDDILQAPLAVILPNTDLVPQPLLKLIANTNTKNKIIPYFIVQTLPYKPVTEIICRYQYALFPNATSEMSGHESIWAQSYIYNAANKEKEEIIKQIEPTQIKIYESDKTKDKSPTILCGNSMKLDTVDNLIGKGIWSLVLGSNSGTLNEEDGMFTEISHVFVGYTYFLKDDDAYTQFLSLMKDKKTLNDVLECIIPELIMDT